jgi:23S rRNA (cytosine1962-C5)-methyltransferase
MEGFQSIRSQLSDYELIDSGDFAKLERFGGRVTTRPEPQAIWHKSLSDDEWRRLSDATFTRADTRAGLHNASEDRGRWELKPGMPDRWTMSYDYGEMQLTLRLALTGFKHVGVFPEQAANWNFIYDTLRAMPTGGVGAKVLNLFAYTGGATLAARSAGADVTHVDSVKQTVAWARDNMTLSGLDGVRWIVDDALKFVQREVRRGRVYDGIILDPPAYGRGPDGEKWVLEQNIAEMLSLCAKLLSPHGFFVLNLYSMGLSALVARSAVRGVFGVPATEQFGELYFSDRSSNELPLGVYYRMTR